LAPAASVDRGAVAVGGITGTSTTITNAMHVDGHSKIDDLHGGLRDPPYILQADVMVSQPLLLHEEQTSYHLEE